MVLNVAGHTVTKGCPRSYKAELSNLLTLIHRLKSVPPKIARYKDGADNWLCGKSLPHETTTIVLVRADISSRFQSFDNCRTNHQAANHQTEEHYSISSKEAAGEKAYCYTFAAAKAAIDANAPARKQRSSLATRPGDSSARNRGRHAQRHHDADDEQRLRPWRRTAVSLSHQH